MWLCDKVIHLKLYNKNAYTLAYAIDCVCFTHALAYFDFKKYILGQKFSSFYVRTLQCAESFFCLWFFFKPSKIGYFSKIQKKFRTGQHFICIALGIYNFVLCDWEDIVSLLKIAVVISCGGIWMHKPQPHRLRPLPSSTIWAARISEAGSSLQPMTGLHVGYLLSTKNNYWVFCNWKSESSLGFGSCAKKYY